MEQLRLAAAAARSERAALHAQLTQAQLAASAAAAAAAAAPPPPPGPQQPPATPAGATAGAAAGTPATRGGLVNSSRVRQATPTGEVGQEEITR